MAVEMRRQTPPTPHTEINLKHGEQVAGYLRSGNNLLYVGKGIFIGECTPPSHNEVGKMMKDHAVPVALIHPVGASPTCLESVWGDEVRFMPVERFNYIVENSPQINVRLASIDFVRELRQKHML